MLDGSRSVFGPEPFNDALAERLAAFDIHPTGPLWGKGELRSRDAAAEVELAALQAMKPRRYASGSKPPGSTRSGAACACARRVWPGPGATTAPWSWRSRCRLAPTRPWYWPSWATSMRQARDRCQRLARPFVGKPRTALYAENRGRISEVTPGIGPGASRALRHRAARTSENAVMNALLRTAVLSLSVMGLSACAGMHTHSGSNYVPPQRAPSIMDDDELYVARVEAIARRRGIDLVWVHVPRKPVATVAQKPTTRRRVSAASGGASKTSTAPVPPCAAGAEWNARMSARWRSSRSTRFLRTGAPLLATHSLGCRPLP